jgi:hypothetical protein
MAAPETVVDVVDRLREIDASLPHRDGVAVFNRMYLTVTERIGAILAGRETVFADLPRMAELDVRFASLWLEAYDAAAAGDRVPPAWAPLFEAREGGRLPVQYAIAGMNAHIEHDLPVAVVATCEARGIDPDELRDDYEAINGVLAEVESEIRRGFLSEVGLAVDDQVGPVVHLISSWNIDKARDVAWVSVETMWVLRRIEFLFDRYLSGLAHTVGMGSRVLLTPTV